MRENEEGVAVSARLTARSCAKIRRVRRGAACAVSTTNVGSDVQSDGGLYVAAGLSWKIIVPWRLITQTAVKVSDVVRRWITRAPEQLE